MPDFRVVFIFFLFLSYRSFWNANSFLSGDRQFVRRRRVWECFGFQLSHAREMLNGNLWEPSVYCDRPNMGWLIVTRLKHRCDVCYQIHAHLRTCCFVCGSWFCYFSSFRQSYKIQLHAETTAILMNERTHPNNMRYPMAIFNEKSKFFIQYVTIKTNDYISTTDMTRAIVCIWHWFLSPTYNIPMSIPKS